MCRRSTETLATEYCRITKAVVYIHGNVHRRFGVQELLDIAAMPRRTFEQHFLRRLGITPHSFINRCRVERATSLVAERKDRSIDRRDRLDERLSRPAIVPAGL